MIAQKSYCIDSDTLLAYIDQHIEWQNGLVVNGAEEDAAFNAGHYLALHLLRKTIESGEIENWSTPLIPTQ